MARVIDPDEIVDPSGACRVELAGVQLTLVCRHGCEGIAHIADPWLFKINQFDPGNRRQNFNRAFRHAGDAWMLVQRNSLVNRMNEVRPELIDPHGYVRDNMIEIEAGGSAR